MNLNQITQIDTIESVTFVRVLLNNFFNLYGVEKLCMSGVKTTLKLSLSKRQRNKIISDLFRYIILIAFSYIMLYPFVYMLINSLKSFEDWFDPSVAWVPKVISFDNYFVAVKNLDYWHALFSTFKNGILPAIFSFISCAVAGYGLARYNFKGKRILFVIMVFCIIIPEMLTIIPSYNTFRHLDFLGILGFVRKTTGVDLRANLIDTPFVFWLPSMLSVGLKNSLFIYIYMQFFKGLPAALEEAAWIDGAGPWKTFLRIVVPSSGAAAITVMVFSVVWYWNDYYLSQIFLTKDFPLSVALANFNTNIAADIAVNYKFTLGSLLITSCFISILPLLCFFLVIQKKFVSSVVTSGIVG